MTGPDGSKHPYFITLAANEPMVFAGLYAHWNGPQGERIESAAIVTVTPNLDIWGIHDRMPAILRGEAVDEWLDTENVTAQEAAALAVTPAPGSLKYHVVGRAVGKVDAEGPELVRPMIPEEVEAKGESARPGKKQAAGGMKQLDLF